jgi:hypothetical protein
MAIKCDICSSVPLIMSDCIFWYIEHFSHGVFENYETPFGVHIGVTLDRYGQNSTEGTSAGLPGTKF